MTRPGKRCGKKSPEEGALRLQPGTPEKAAGKRHTGKENQAMKSNEQRAPGSAVLHTWWEGKLGRAGSCLSASSPPRRPSPAAGGRASARRCQHVRAEPGENVYSYQGMHEPCLFVSIAGDSKYTSGCLSLKQNGQC